MAPRSTLSSGALFVSSLLLAGPAPAAPAQAAEHGKATIGDRIDQVIATFTRDPSAGVDIDMKHVLDRWRAMGPEKLETLDAATARRQPTPIEAAAALLKDAGGTLDAYAVATRDVTLPGPAGPLRARVFLPAGHAAAPRPVILFYHGGGFVLENGASTEASPRALAGASGYLVIAPEYRLAPEARFPAAADDALAAYRWVLANAAGLGGDPERIALAGEGAGGTLAVDTGIAARDAKLAMPKALVLIAPAAGIDMKTASYLQDAAARPWSQKAVQWAMGLALADPAQRNDPRIDLVGRADVAGLPPTTIVTAEVDPLRSEGERLGGKLRMATVPVELRDYPGVTHDFFGMGAAVARAGEAQRFVAERLKNAFYPPAKETAALN